MQFDIITIFPKIFSALTEFGITRRAFKQKKYALSIWNPRDFTIDNRRTIDKKPYGGGPGMVMLAKPLQRSLAAARQRQINLGLPMPRVVYLSPQGKPITHQRIMQLAKNTGIILLCGRYRGIDQRLLDSDVDEELSLGDFILSGGELPAMILMDAMIRHLPGVLYDKDIITLEDSFTHGLLDYPYYTRPKIYKNISVPSILLSGHHAYIKKWKRERILEKTAKKRPDLIVQARKNNLLNETDEQFLKNLTI